MKGLLSTLFQDLYRDSEKVFNIINVSFRYHIVSFFNDACEVHVTELRILVKVGYSLSLFFLAFILIILSPMMTCIKLSTKPSDEMN